VLDGGFSHLCTSHILPFFPLVFSSCWCPSLARHAEPGPRAWEPRGAATSAALSRAALKHVVVVVTAAPSQATLCHRARRPLAFWWLRCSRYGVLDEMTMRRERRYCGKATRFLVVGSRIHLCRQTNTISAQTNLF
jgi:hypothetical protein